MGTVWQPMYALLGDRSILVVRIAKFRPLREPIRIFLVTLDQFANIININKQAHMIGRFYTRDA